MSNANDKPPLLKASAKEIEKDRLDFFKKNDPPHHDWGVRSEHPHKNDCDDNGGLGPHHCPDEWDCRL